MSELFEQWRGRLESAVRATEERGYWSPFSESASRRHHPDGARAAGQAAFEACLGQRFELSQPGECDRVGEEVSPFTQQPLGVSYPRCSPDALVQAARAALPAWRDAGVQARVGCCMEILGAWEAQVFANAFATMHTAGQTFRMAFAGSGANSLDRGLEAVAMAWKAMSTVPVSSVFRRSFGGPEVVLDKRYRLVPRGVAVVISCGSYPAWNAWPAVLANLATGNPVVVKPHPRTVLPVALAVRAAREVLVASGHSPDLISLAVDTLAEPGTVALAQHPAVRIVDFTGSPAFGAWLQSSCPQAQVFTETAGCNAVVLESALALPPVGIALAQGLSIFSAQMCTAAQNIFVPRDGIRVGEARVSLDEIVAHVVSRVDGMVAAHGPDLCGAVQDPHMAGRLAALGDEPRVTVARPSGTYAHPTWPQARTVTPAVLRVDADARDLYAREHFGPVAFFIACEDRDHALACATRDAREHGAIASYLYSVDVAWREQAVDAFLDAGASVGCNLLGQLPINYAAAYSDFHVTGLDPAGTACLTDLAFVARRFGVVQAKVERPRSENPS